MGDAVFDMVLMFFAYTKMLGRIETRTRDRIYCQTIRTVRDISLDDRARSKNCDLQFANTFRDKENYSIDGLCVAFKHWWEKAVISHLIYRKQIVCPPSTPVLGYHSMLHNKSLLN